MGDITDPRLLWCKGMLFLLLGMLGAALILLMHPSPQLMLLMAITVWAFCRAYYFAFYAIERYVDARFRFAGLISVAQYLLKHRRVE